MKRFFASLGKGAVYLLIFLGIQALVSLVYGTVQAAFLLTSPEAAGMSLNSLMTELSGRIMGKIVPVSLVCSLLTIGAYGLTAPMRRRSLREHLWLYPMRPRSIAPVLLLGASVNLLVAVLMTILPFPEQWMADYEFRSAPIASETSVLSFLAVAVAAPAAEELCFRGLLFTRLRQGMPQLAAALISSLLFGLIHGSLIWFFYTFPLGLVMVWVFCRFQSLWASILFHMAFNAAGQLLPADANVLFVLLLGCAGTVGGAIWITKGTVKPALPSQ